MDKNLENFYCIPKNLKNLTLEGAFDQGYSQLIKFSFSICKNDTTQKCKELETIKKEMSNGYIGIFFIDKNLDLGNFENYYREQPKEVYTNYLLTSKKQISVKLQNNYLYTDDGLVFEQLSTNRIINFNNYQEYNFLYPDDNFLDVMLKLDQIKIIHKRNFEKLQELLAQVGGTLNILFLFCTILNSVYNKYTVIRDILFEVFTIKFIKNIKEKESDRKKKYELGKETLNPKKEFIKTGVDDVPIQISKEANRKSSHFEKIRHISITNSGNYFFTLLYQYYYCICIDLKIKFKLVLRFN